MNKRILAVYYTQSGQTRQILDSFLQPMIAQGAEIDYLQVRTQHTFPFPWSIPVFFDTVPESVEVIPTPLQPWTTRYDRYDLVVLAWQPWNLSPSIPMNSILQDERFKAIIKDTPLVSICGCRNMWINAMEKNKKLFAAAGTRHVGNIALVDRHLNHLSYITIFHWLGTGKKDRKWRIFPLPGVSDKDIAGAAVFGATVNDFLAAGNWENLQATLRDQKAVNVKYSLMFIERKAGKIFQKWVNIINKHPQKRKNILVAYKYYLAVALLLASPIILLVDLILMRPFNQKKIRQQLSYYSSVDYNPNI
ncbi:MAG: hypothetical protein J7539_02045 [Niabella sp.]|nr:hypothetical protein [Niabella sp.]